jgi:hypothetical protein
MFRRLAIVMTMAVISSAPAWAVEDINYGNAVQPKEEKDKPAPPGG